MTELTDVLDFWFGELDERGIAAEEASRRWFMKSDAFDDEIRTRFGDLRLRIMAGEHEEWLENNDGLVAYVVVLDQFSRNLGRGTPAMYEADAQALRVCQRAIEDGRHLNVGIDYATTLFMPFMHSEELADQDRCVELFEQLSEANPDIARLRKGVEYAIAHRDIVARFGHFPHRNEIVGRASTPEEIEFLNQPGSSF